MTKRVTGTKEWAASTINIQNGCQHNCRYCYAKSMALRFGRITPETWTQPTPQRAHSMGKREGTIMFPSTHDITQENIEQYEAMVLKLLGIGNKVLIVSKPTLACIMRLCSSLVSYKDKVLFRFTIGSSNTRTLAFWEPGAPTFEERLACLRHAHDTGYQTSVSCEPMIDGAIADVISKTEQFVTESIWLGRANKLMARVKKNCQNDPESMEAATLLDATWSDDKIKVLYELYKNNPMIKWKDSIKKVMGLPSEAGEI